MKASELEIFLTGMADEIEKCNRNIDIKPEYATVNGLLT